MGHELARAVERWRQSVAASRLERQTTPASTGGAERRLGLALEPGARVFDVVTGEHMEVVSATRENVVAPHAER